MHTSTDIYKQRIIDLFNANVKNVKIDLSCYNKNNYGKEGHWLETRFGIVHNSNNKPDIFGYEIKKNSKKITLGDFSASEYLFTQRKPNINTANEWTDTQVLMKKEEFIRYFGTPNLKKHNRLSWSGSCVPKYNVWNSCGQTISVLLNNDIVVYYSFSKDLRPEKVSFPEYLKKDNVMIVIWKSEKMRKHINDKFNNCGFIICKKNADTYTNLCFGAPFNFELFITEFKNRQIIFDSGMHNGKTNGKVNSRNYSMFRTTNSNFWNKLILEEY